MDMFGAVENSFFFMLNVIGWPEEIIELKSCLKTRFVYLNFINEYLSWLVIL